MILKRYKNQIFQAINESGIDFNRLTTIERTISERDYFTIRYNDEFEFSIRNTDDSFSRFEYKFSRFEKKYPKTNWLPQNGYSTISDIISLIKNWLDTEFSDYVSEENLTDFWENAKQNRNSLKLESIEFEDNSEFTIEEKEQVKLGLNEVQILLIDRFNLKVSQIEVVKSRLKYLEEAIERNTKTDWKNIAISTFIGLILNLGVDTSMGKDIWNLLISIFNNLPTLPLP